MKIKVKRHVKNIYLGCVLALSSGALSAYTYIYHHGVFAGFQTGNIIKLGISIGQENFSKDLPFVVSIFSFVLGIIITRYIHYRFDDDRFVLHRNRMVLLYMLAMMIFVAIFNHFIPDYISNALLSIGAAAQFEEFRKINGIAYTPMMMSGNLRFLTENIFDRMVHSDPIIHQNSRRNVAHISIIMGSYIIGPILVSITSHFLSDYAILIPIILILIAILIISFDIRKIEAMRKKGIYIK